MCVYVHTFNLLLAESQLLSIYRYTAGYRAAGSTAKPRCASKNRLKWPSFLAAAAQRNTQSKVLKAAAENDGSCSQRWHLPLGGGTVGRWGDGGIHPAPCSPVPGMSAGKRHFILLCLIPDSQSHSAIVFSFTYWYWIIFYGCYFSTRVLPGDGASL